MTPGHSHFVQSAATLYTALLTQCVRKQLVLNHTTPNKHQHQFTAPKQQWHKHPYGGDTSTK